MRGSFKILLKMFLVLAIIIGVMSVLSGAVYAENFNWGTALSDADKHAGVSDLNKSATNVTGSILSVCKYVAVGIALIMIVIIATKYMIASAGDRADIKKHAIAYVTGAMILFGSAAILDIIQGFAEKTITTGGGNP